MGEIGQFVQEAIDCSGRNLSAQAFSLGCRAFDETLKKKLGSEEVSEKEYKDFIVENWWICEFMGLLGRGRISDDVVDAMKAKIPGFGSTHKIDDVFAFIVKRNVITEAMPVGFEFHSSLYFESKDEKIFVPNRFVYGLIGTAIFNPINKDESLPDNYWLEFGSFRIFVSELWGRTDLLERAVNFN
ncbi:MAG: hypothetical protein HKN25_15840 [Pyrinomonadaceae bacterium]|nr:hypothetical protein [Pyrinomonadaceae bacterium]